MATNPFLEALSKGRGLQMNPELAQQTTGREPLPTDVMAGDPVGFGTVMSGGIMTPKPQAPDAFAPNVADALFSGGSSMVPMEGFSPETFSGAQPTPSGITVTELSTGRSAPLASIEGQQIQQAGMSRAEGPVEPFLPTPPMAAAPQQPSIPQMPQAPQTIPTPQATPTEPTFAGQPLSEFLAGGTQLDPQGRMIDPSVDRSDFEQAAAGREQRLESMLADRAAARQAQRGGEAGGITDSQFRALSEGNQDVERRLRAQAELGMGQFADPKQTERESRVENLMGTMGLSRAEAMGFVEGTTRVSRDPVTGEASIIDMVTGQAKPVTTEQMEQAGIGEQGITDNPESQSLFNMAKESTGLMPSILSGLQKIAGQAGVEVKGAPEVIEARQAVTNAQQGLVRALANNPRFPVGEMERIRQEINIMPSAFTDPVTLESRMRAVDKSLRTRLDNAIGESQKKGVPATQRQEYIRMANDIANFLDILGVPEETEGRGDAPSELPSGVEADVWEAMTPEEQALFQ